MSVKAEWAVANERFVSIVQWNTMVDDALWIILVCEAVIFVFLIKFCNDKIDI